MTAEIEKLFNVVCINTCDKISVNIPRKERPPIESLPFIQIGKEYTVVGIKEYYGKTFYWLSGFPKNHVFESRAFIEKM